MSSQDSFSFILLSQSYKTQCAYYIELFILEKKTEVIIHEWGQYACLILLVIISPFSLQELLPLRSQTLCHLNLLGFPILSVAVID